MKLNRIILVLIIMSVFSGVAMAKIIGDTGFGLHGSIYKNAEVPDKYSGDIITRSWADLVGITLYGNIGWGFGKNDFFSLRLELYTALDIFPAEYQYSAAYKHIIAPSGQLRLLASIKPLPSTSFSVFAGGGDSALISWRGNDVYFSSWIVGARIQYFIFFLDYSVMLNTPRLINLQNKHELTLGMSLSALYTDN